MLARTLSFLGFTLMGLTLFGLELSELISKETARTISAVSVTGAIICFGWLGTLWLFGKARFTSPVVAMPQPEAKLTNLQVDRLRSALLDMMPVHGSHFSAALEDVMHDLLKANSLIRDCRVCGKPRFS